MGTLSLALFCEGDTDGRFLRPVIERTARRLLDKHERYDIEVLPLLIIKDNKKKRDLSILGAALEAKGYHALIVHADADCPQAEQAWRERFEPGYKLVQQTSKSVCKDLLAIIPIQAIEAWMMADYKLLLEEMGSTNNTQEFDIPESAKLVEAIAKPKQRLMQAVQKEYSSRSKRRRGVDIDFLYQPVGERISLDRLNQVPSYKQFVQDLATMLASFNFIRPVV